MNNLLMLVQNEVVLTYKIYCCFSANSSGNYVLIKSKGLDRIIKSKGLDRPLDSASHFLRTRSNHPYYSRAYNIQNMKALVS